MKHAVRVLLITAIFGLTAMALHAQDKDLVEVKVPFDFVAAHTTLPAGTYTVERVWFNEPGNLLLRDRAGNSVFLDAPVVGQPKGATRLVFKRYNGQYFLQEIRTDAGVHQLLKVPAEASIAEATASGSTGTGLH